MSFSNTNTVEKKETSCVSDNLSKLLRLVTSFETLRMQDNETFDDFYVKLSDIDNSSFNLGEVIPENRFIRKILRSLPERFHYKVVAVEETKDLDTLKVDQLIGNL